MDPKHTALQLQLVLSRLQGPALVAGLAPAGGQQAGAVRQKPQAAQQLAPHHSPGQNLKVSSARETLLFYGPAEETNNI